MAAWTLPAVIADWCKILTSVLDQRSRKYFFTIILGMLLGCGRRTVSCWFQLPGRNSLHDTSKNVAPFSMMQVVIERSDWEWVQQALATTNGRIVHAHTSGHALSSDVVAFTRAVNGKTVIPIHTVKPENFCGYFNNVTLATDGHPSEF